MIETNEIVVSKPRGSGQPCTVCQTRHESMRKKAVVSADIDGAFIAVFFHLCEEHATYLTLELVQHLLEPDDKVYRGEQ